MRSRINIKLAINALLMAVRRQNLTWKVVMHSNRGCQNINRDWQFFLKAHDIEVSMSRRYNCYDNAVAESFFLLLKH